MQGAGIVGNDPVNAEFYGLHDFFKTGFRLGDSLLRSTVNFGRNRAVHPNGTAEDAVNKGQRLCRGEIEDVAEAAGDTPVGQHVAAEKAVATRHGQIQAGRQAPSGETLELPGNRRGRSFQRPGLADAGAREFQRAPGGGKVVVDAAAVEFIEAQRARQRIGDWLNARGLRFAELEIENGSGLSRRERISADSLNRVLLDAWKNPVMPEYISSLPIVGIDGTMKKRLNGSEATGRAHIKTGTLDGVKTAAGYALDARGRRYAVTFLINRPRAQAGSAAIDALLVWVAQRRAGEKNPVLEDE